MRELWGGGWWGSFAGSESHWAIENMNFISLYLAPGLSITVWTLKSSNV